MRNRIFVLILLLCVSGCYREQAIPVTADFSVSVEHEDYSAPARIFVENKSAGAEEFKWTFEGGDPASSDKRSPGAIVYRNAGTYLVRLEAWNRDERKIKEYTLQFDSAVTAVFSIEILVNDISPVQAVIHNASRGGTVYKWTFEGGNPASFDLYSPPPVTFTAAGEHTVKLEVSNSRETFSYTQTLTVQPAMTLDFDIVPSFENEDMEAPLTATLKNLSVNGLKYKWTGVGGVIASDTATVSTTVHYAAEGEYTVKLEADNGKEIRSVSKSITVKPNSNLYTIRDVKLGVRSAHVETGSFFSCALRRTVAKDEMDSESAPPVDFAFFGLNEDFRYCRFVSPDSVSRYAFFEIAGATHTAIVNLPENSPLNFSISDFDSMNDDSFLAPLPISANDDGEAYFTNAAVPRVSLFETADGRKGAVKIKSFVSAGQESYIYADIKVQKKHRP